MKNIIYIFLIFHSTILSNDSKISLNDFNDDRIEHFVFNLEPFGVSTYIYNKYFPNYTVDHYENAFFIDGSLGLPIYQNISHKLYFDSNEDGTFTQLSYKQKKTDLFFDTKIALKTDINDLTKFVFKGESKSIVNNINQNYVLSIDKKKVDSNLKIGYMYHIEEDPSIEFYQNIKQEIESFHIGFSYELYKHKMKYNISSSIQISNNNRLLENEYNYDLRSTWNNLDVKYRLNNNFDLISYIQLKNQLIEKSDTYSLRKKSHIGIGANYHRDKINLNLGVEKLNDEYLPKLTFNLKNKYSMVSILHNNFIANAPLNENLDILYENISNFQFKYSYNREKYYSVLSTGQINTPSFDYMYYSFNGGYKLPYSIIDFDYYFYDSDLTYFKENLISSFTIVPPFKSNKYKIYGKVSLYNFKINQRYDIDLESINLFNINDEFILTNYDVNLIDVEFGFIFKTFKISFTRKNPHESQVFINQNNLSFIRYDYIDVVWYFKD